MRDDAALDTAKVASYLSDGATLVYNHLHETSHAVQRIQETLEYQLDARVWIQAYLTRSDESAFGMHVDDHNFIALQIFGTKTWDMESPAGATAEVNTVTLRPGDIIGAPANVPHRVTGNGSLSLHLTIAFDWLDDNRIGSVLPDHERDSHRGTARQGSVISFALCSEMDALRLPFKFRDRVRPTAARRDRGIELTSSAGRLLLDHRFTSLVAQLASGAELTKAQMLQSNPDLDENDLDKFLRFGVERDVLLCSG